VSESKVGQVQSVYPEMRGGYISSGREGGCALYFSFDNVIGPNVMRGDKVRFETATRDRATCVQLIPKFSTQLGQGGRIE
jgi:hypothetical protein